MASRCLNQVRRLAYECREQVLSHDLFDYRGVVLDAIAASDALRHGLVVLDHDWGDVAVQHASVSVARRCELPVSAITLLMSK